jgi:protein-L-isoaspartate(D-aspartate) O-methyltransferase
MGGKGDTRRERELMVERQIQARGLNDPAVLRAMLTVPREAFVPEELQDRAYFDAALPIPDGQTISQPYIVALMATALQLKPSDRVLEIGTGSGYAAAVLSRIAQEVYTVERHASLALAARERLKALRYDNVHIGHGDGTLGWPEHAPYDAITVAASGPQVPDTLRAQLKIGGRLVMPTGSSRIEQKLVRVTRESEDEYAEENMVSVSFVPLIGREGWEDGQ